MGKPFRLYFHGPFLLGRYPSKEIADLPAASGIYCVYACDRCAFDKAEPRGKPLYIGQCGGPRDRKIRDRWHEHEKADLGRKGLIGSEERCYTWARCEEHHTLSNFLNRIENAMLVTYKPRFNCNKKSWFGPWSTDTTIEITGCNVGLEPFFIHIPAGETRR